jgi:hypothetical protein
VSSFHRWSNVAVGADVRDRRLGRARLQPVVESLDDVQTRRARHDVPTMAVATPANTPVERSRLANGLCDVLCNAVPVEVRGTLLGRTSAVWADCWH